MYEVGTPAYCQCMHVLIHFQGVFYLEIENVSHQPDNVLLTNEYKIL